MEGHIHIPVEPLAGHREGKGKGHLYPRNLKAVNGTAWQSSIWRSFGHVRAENERCSRAQASHTEVVGSCQINSECWVLGEHANGDQTTQKCTSDLGKETTAAVIPTRGPARF